MAVTHQGFWSRFRYQYEQLLHETRDPRTDGWLLMESPVPTVSAVVVYLVVVYYGQQVMRDRKPFELKNLMMTYNLALVLLNAYIFYEFLISTWLNPAFSKLCQPVDYSNDELAVRMARACWWFYFSKLIEFLDTIFFVLRKKNNQISFLHVYHHSTMPLLWYIGARVVPGGEAYLCASINSFIHILMYSYYFLSAMGPHMQKYLWWKRYMTALQLVQFWWILLHTLSAIYISCFDNSYNWALVFYVLSHILLFTNFYIQTYINKKYSKHSRDAKELDKPAKNGITENHIQRESSANTRHRKPPLESSL